MYFPHNLKLLKYRHLNFIKTVMVNFKLCPFRIAIKMPIFLFGKVDISDCKKGRAIFPNGVRRGMLCFGLNCSRLTGYHTPAISRFAINGVIEIRGHCDIANGAMLEIQPKGKLILENDVWINSNLKLFAEEKIHIGEHVRMSWDVQIFDTDFHYMLRGENGDVHKKTAEVFIGANSWICNRVTINKGSFLPDKTTVSSNSLVCRDFSELKSGSIIGGIPAKFLKDNSFRIVSLKIEFEIDSRFENDMTKTSIHINDLENCF